MSVENETTTRVASGRPSKHPRTVAQVGGKAGAPTASGPVGPDVGAYGWRRRCLDPAAGVLARAA